ncbi:monovalent cation/H(+) antiporter subunit G [Gulosibacter sp. 10]|uniref:monovalent cation/H(+) antiporter subunit G n=1 Tax=Gulosibacter sp. 10 TaxID=1255570 RepID=UPI00097F0A32|nr:monovalent cation/H(+) antiporter subunit G [Gulosibacter sp. 10]SJM64863.1 Na(+) H(+) antiporter subunit G [Gulosibacter sp. 10]
MSGNQWLDLATLVLVLLGALLSLSAGIGLLRFSDMIGRLHAQSKPQAAGLLFILVGLAIQQTGWTTTLFLIPIVVFQFLTTPAAGMVLARGGYRSKHYEHVPLHVDELEAEVERAQRAEERAEARERQRLREHSGPGAETLERDEMEAQTKRDIDPESPGSVSL